MAAAEAANCIMEVSAWNAAGGGGRPGGRCFMSRRRGCESADLSKGLQPSGGESACSGSGPPFRCGLPSFRGGLRYPAQTLVSGPLPRGGGLGALPAWPPRGRGAVGGEGVCRARWPGGLHVRDKGPAPGRGRGARGGGGGRLSPF